MSTAPLRRRRWFVRLALLCVGVVGAPPVAEAQTVQQRKPTFEERLVFGLQVRRPSEFEFISAVVDTVDRGELPQKVVDRVFAYARRRRDRSRQAHRPIIYFQAALLRVVEPMRITIAPTP